MKDKLFASAKWRVDIEYQGDEINYIYHLSDSMPEEAGIEFLRIVDGVRKKLVSDAHRL